MRHDIMCFASRIAVLHVLGKQAQQTTALHKISALNLHDASWNYEPSFTHCCPACPRKASTTDNGTAQDLSFKFA